MHFQFENNNLVSKHLQNRNFVCSYVDITDLQLWVIKLDVLLSWKTYFANSVMQHYNETPQIYKIVKFYQKHSNKLRIS